VTPDETVDLLTVAAAFDQRTVGEGDAMAWHAVLGDLEFPDARQAILGHYAESADRVMPAHIRQRVREARVQRIQDAGIPAPPPELVDDPPAYRAALHAAAVAIADGRDPEAAMQAIVRQAPRELEAS
jgi:hypothetical protein